MGGNNELRKSSWRNGTTGDRASNERRSQADSIWGVKHIGEKVRDFVEGVKEKSPREAVRNITEAADHAKNQAKD